MSAATRLPVTALRRCCSPADIPFATTADAAPPQGLTLGQERAAQAMRFGVRIRRPGYNLFALGPAGIGKRTMLRRFLDDYARQREPATDWCYVHNFDDVARPRVLELPAALGAQLSRDMVRTIQDLRTGMRAAFESEEYRTRKQQLIRQFAERQQRALADAQQAASKHDVAVAHGDAGLALAPIRDGAPLPPEKFHALPPDVRAQHQAQLERVGHELEALLRSFHDWGREHHAKLSALDREMAATTARRVLDGMRASYAQLPDVLEHLAHVERDVVENTDELLEGSTDGIESALRRAMTREGTDGPAFRRYQINVLVDRADLRGAPVVYEDNPTHANLVGHVDHETKFGSLVTNLTLIRAGAFHRANGGYLLLDAREVLRHPSAWDAVKRTLRSGQVRVESVGQALGLASTVTLDPEPVALGDTKVVLMGDRLLYYLLASLDPDVLELFKVVVDFEHSVGRTPDALTAYASAVAALTRDEALRPLDRAAVARVVDHGARDAGDADKLAVHMRGLVDLLRETDFWASEAKRDVATAADVQRAIDERLARTGRVRRRLHEAIQRGDVLIATGGDAVGQINGLSVTRLGERSFGHPTRITARTRLGTGEVIDIEREVALGGPIHSKGVLILGGYLGARYAPNVPLSLSATLVFEQSYAGVEGDSASLAELCALLSSLADRPLRQALAVTGSVNQQGRVQSVGGVNDKIEGFFDVCNERGLTGDQGVVIPRSNVKNLMLRADVVDAVDRGQFHIYAVDRADEAIELLTGIDAGERDGSGAFRADTINGMVEARLRSLADRARAFGAPGRDADANLLRA